MLRSESLPISLSGGALPRTLSLCRARWSSPLHARPLPGKRRGLTVCGGLRSGTLFVEGPSLQTKPQDVVRRQVPEGPGFVRYRPKLDAGRALLICPAFVTSFFGPFSRVPRATGTATGYENSKILIILASSFQGERLTYSASVSRCS